MATVRKRGSTYQIRVSCGYNSKNEQITKTMTYKPLPNMTEKQIQKELERQKILFEERCRTGQFLDGNIKLADFIDKWFNDYAAKHLKAKTYALYQDLSKRVLSALGHIRLDRLQPRHLLDFYNNLSECGIRIDTKYKAVDAFKDILNKNKLTHKALSEKANVSEYVISSCVNGRNVSKTTAEKIMAILPKTFYEVENNKPLSAKTIQHYHRFISSVLSTAVEWQIIPYNPCGRVKAPKVERTEANCLDEVQAAELIKALDAEPLRYKTLIMLLLYSGMRRGELCGLEWSDINFDYNLISITKSRLYLPDRGVFDDTTKNKSSERVIKIPQGMIDLLKEYKLSQLQERLKLGDQWIESDKVFTSWNGKPIHPDTVSGWFSKFIKRNNLPAISIHSLRHTNATLLIASGTDIRTVANRLGHSSPTTTSNIYAHAIRSADEAAAERLNDILNPIKKQKVN